MSHRLQRQQLPSQSGGGPRTREKTCQPSAAKSSAASHLNPTGRGRPSVERTHGEGNIHSIKRANTSVMLSESNYSNHSCLEFPTEFKQDVSKKGSGTPIKTLINEEMSKEARIRRSSPSLVARLMGLDILPPPQVVPTQQRKVGRSLQNASSVGFQEKHANCDHSLWVSSEKEKEFKDVFEVVGAAEVQRMKNKHVWKGKSGLRQSEINLDYIRRKFMDAKRLSTDEALCNSKELDEALEVLDSNKDLFLKFLQEPNSFFTKHLQDLNWLPPSPSPHLRNITILKSSKGIKYQTVEGCCDSEGNVEGHIHTQKDLMTSVRKPATRSVHHTLKEHNCSPTHKLSKDPKHQYKGKIKHCPHPTSIVVLKPGLVKTEGMDSRNSSSREFQMSGLQELYAEKKERQNLSNNVQDMVQNSRSSREIVREISKELGHTVRSSTKKVSCSGINGCNREKISFLMSDMDNLYNPESCPWNPVYLDGCSNSFSTSSSYSTESSGGRRESRKRLSENWKITHHFQEVGPTCGGSSTLTEMLSVSDTEVANRTMEFSTLKFSDEKLACDGASPRCSCSTGISSRDCWKEGFPRNVLTAPSLPSSSSVYGCSEPATANMHRVGSKKCFSMIRDVLNQDNSSSLKHKSNSKRNSSCRSSKHHSHKPLSCNSCAEENRLHKRYIHVDREVRSNIDVIHVAEKKASVSCHTESRVGHSDHLVANISVSEMKDKKVSFADDKHSDLRRPLEVLVKNVVTSGCDHNNIVTEVASCDHCEVGYLHSQSQLTESVAAVCSKESDQPSPISVLELPSEEEKSSSGCFKKIGKDLKELRMQLRLLKMDSIDTYAEELEDTITNDEDSGVECHFPLHNGEIIQAFRDEMDRDFSYLVDMLIVSGIRGANWSGLSDACHSTDNPIDPTVFDILEEKYSIVVSWRRSERKLFFDLINSILAENLVCCNDLNQCIQSERRSKPTSIHEDLVEDMWQILDRYRKKLSSEQETMLSRWPDLCIDVDVGLGIEGMLKEELLEELVSELILV